MAAPVLTPDLNELRGFCMAADLGSLGRAALRLHVSQPSLSKRLASLGYAVRVVGDRNPYRVRVGRYATRERAGDAVRQMARQNVHGVIVEAEPR